MIRFVLDTNVLMAALLSPRGAPFRLVELCSEGLADVVVSPMLLCEFERVLGRPHLRAQIDDAERASFIEQLRLDAVLVPDPAPTERMTADPGDEYLVLLARASKADAIVSGDHHLLELDSPIARVITPRAALALLERLN